MAKARKKVVYRCTKCNKRFGSSPQSAQHFAKHPSHRTAKQESKFQSNQRSKAINRRKNQGIQHRRTAYGALPTVERTTRTRSSTMKFCTVCGTRKMPSHSFCGGCGDKL